MKSELKKHLKDQLYLETRAKELYEEYAKRFTEEETKALFKRIRDEEEKHERLVEEMLSVFE